MSESLTSDSPDTESNVYNNQYMKTKSKSDKHQCKKLSWKACMRLVEFVSIHYITEVYTQILFFCNKKLH